MDDIHLERLGGMGGFGGANSALRSTGALSSTQLSDNDRHAIESLFQTGAPPDPAGAADMFRYRITWETEQGARTIEVPESAVPDTLRNAVKDELR
jgi:hypothetical protein